MNGFIVEKEVKILSELLDRKLAVYGRIMEALREEAACLRSGSIEGLVTVVSTIDRHTERLHHVETLIEAAIGRMADLLGVQEQEKSLSTFIGLLPPIHQGKLGSHQPKLVQLQTQIGRINERNKAFIQDHLTLLRELSSSLLHPAPELTGYSNTGRPPSTALSYALDCEV